MRHLINHGAEGDQRRAQIELVVLLPDVVEEELSQRLVLRQKLLRAPATEPRQIVVAPEHLLDMLVTWLSSRLTPANRAEQTRFCFARQVALLHLFVPGEPIALVNDFQGPT